MIGEGTTIDILTTETTFGEGVIDDIGEVLQREGIRQPMIVTDEGIADAGILARVTDLLTEAGDITEFATYFATTEPTTEDFDDLPSDSTDGIIAVGGGSCIDTAKIASILLAHGGSPEEYLGVGTVPGPVAPVVAVPTTSGTGSQCTQTAVVANDDVKRGISDEHIRPNGALVDPTFTYNLPAPVTARSGYDAFMHAVESYLAKDVQWVPDRAITYQGANPISRGLSRTAIELIHGSLERAALDGDDREARRKMSLGSHVAGAAFSIAGLGIVHALASTFGGLRHRPHGECLGAATRIGLEYNYPVRKREYAEICRLIGIETTRSTSETVAFIEECERLVDTLGLPSTARDLGFESGDVETLFENTMAQERRLLTNPRSADSDLKVTLSNAIGK